jgi:hypothetical protein
MWTLLDTTTLLTSMSKQGSYRATIIQIRCDIRMGQFIYDTYH